MWLTFNAILVRWYGLDALKATPAIYKVFKPREWLRLSVRSDSAGSLDPTPNLPRQTNEWVDPPQDRLH
jgi:hypothetical protein